MDLAQEGVGEPGQALRRAVGVHLLARQVEQQRVGREHVVVQAVVRGLDGRAVAARQPQRAARARYGLVARGGAVGPARAVLEGAAAGAAGRLRHVDLWLRRPAVLAVQVLVGFGRPRVARQRRGRVPQRGRHGEEHRREANRHGGRAVADLQGRGCHGFPGVNRPEPARGSVRRSVVGGRGVWQGGDGATA